MDLFAEKYKNNLNSIVIYQYNLSATDSIPYQKISFSKTDHVLNISTSLWDEINFSWIETNKSIDTLDDKNRLLSSTWYQKNYILSTQNLVYWDTVRYYRKTYGINGLSLDESYSWSKISSKDPAKKWFNLYYIEIYKDNKGNDTLKKSGYLIDNNSFIVLDTKKTINKYNIDGTLSSQQYNSSEIRYSYFDNKIQSDTYGWDGNYYINLSSTLDSIGLTETKHASRYNSTANLVFTNKENYVFNENNELKIKSSYKLDENFNDWWISSNTYRSFYYYGNETQINNKTELNSNIEIYPNPATTQINVKINSNNNSSGSIELFSIDGKQMRSLKLNNGNNVLNTYGLKQGMYFIVVNSNEIAKKQKIIISK
jgi:hypothetical protein